MNLNLRLKFAWRFFAMSAAFLLLPLHTEAQTSTITINSQQQVIRGFGGMNFPRWIADLTSAQADLAFGNGSGQIGLSILRISVPSVQNDWAGEVPTAQRAVNHGAIVFATPWSPPASMKSNNNIIGGQLNSSSYGAYANYLTDFANYMSSNGAGLYAVSVQNEPDFLPDYESCGWTASQIRTFLDNNASVIPVKVIAPETVNPKSSWFSTLSSASQLDIYADHLYGGGPTNFNKEHWMTEHYTSSNVDANSWPDALGVGREVHNCMINNYSAYTWWYIRRSYGLITENGSVSKRGYVMSHFSKFVRPGYNRVAATAAPASNVSVSAYSNGTTLVIVAINQNSSSQNITFNLSGGQVATFTKYQTTSSSNVGNAGSISAGTSFTNSLAGNSIATFVGTIGGGGGSEQVWLESECATVGSLWNTVANASASNGFYTTIQSGNNSTGSAPTNSTGYINFPFSVSASGTFYMNARVLCPSGNDDSWWVRMDGGSWVNWNNIAATSWSWAQFPNTFNLSAGNHTLTFAYREDGAQLDKINLSTSSALPSGTGSAASNLCTPGGTTLSVSPTTVNVAAAANSTGTFNVTSNTSWTVTDNQTWLTVSPTSGSNNATVTVTAQQNTGASRQATVTVTASGASPATVTVTQAAAGGGSTSVWLEAECASVGSLFNIPTDAAASNSRYVTIQSGNNSTGSAPTNTAGHLNFSFSVSASGTYRVFARVKHPTANDDSWWVRMDGGSWVSWNNFAATSWTWGQFPNTFSLTAGSHTLTFAYREDGAQLDKVNITTSTTTPTGTGTTAENLCTPKFGEVEQIKPEPPKGFELSQNYPNPFNPSTVISFGLPENSYVSVKVYNSLGEEIAELTGREYSAGWHSVSFDASELASGVYFYALRAGKFSTSKKMLLQK